VNGSTLRATAARLAPRIHRRPACRLKAPQGVGASEPVARSRSADRRAVARKLRTWLALALIGPLAGCEPPSATEAPHSTVFWRHVATWSGRGDTQTESFVGDTGGFRFRWTTRNEASPGAGRFTLTLHSAISGRPLVTAVDERGVGGDTAYVSEDPRTFHVVIHSTGVDWTVVVEEPIVVVEEPGRREEKPRSSQEAGVRLLVAGHAGASEGVRLSAAAN
jgi:hypothetical protein